MLFTLVLVALSTSFIACSSDDDDDTNVTIKFDIEKVEVNPDKTTSVKVSGGSEPYTAKVGDEEIATVTVEANTLTITGVSEGETSIIVTDKNNHTATITVSVKADGIDFDKKELTLKVEAEEVVTIIGGVAPYLATSGNEEIATVTVEGDKLTVKGIKAGTTVITVIGEDKKNSGTLSVTVE